MYAIETPSQVIRRIIYIILENYIAINEVDLRENVDMTQEMGRRVAITKQTDYRGRYSTKTFEVFVGSHAGERRRSLQLAVYGGVGRSMSGSRKEYLRHMLGLLPHFRTTGFRASQNTTVSSILGTIFSTIYHHKFAGVAYSMLFIIGVDRKRITEISWTT